MFQVIVFQIIGSGFMILVSLAAIDARRGHTDCYLQPFAVSMSIVNSLLFMVQLFHSFIIIQQYIDVLYTAA